MTSQALDSVINCRKVHSVENISLNCLIEVVSAETFGIFILKIIHFKL